MFFFKMAAGSHFGCPKITFDRISYHFRSIPQFLFCEFLSQNGHWRPFLTISDRYGIFLFFENFLMSEIHFRSHFWPFHINRPFWMSEIHFRSHFWPFQIDTELFGCPKFTFDRISAHFRLIWNFFFRRPFWMSENHFRSHFWTFQIDTELFF